MVIGLHKITLRPQRANEPSRYTGLLLQYYLVFLT